MRGTPILRAIAWPDGTPEIDVAHQIARGQRLDPIGSQTWSRPPRVRTQHHNAGELAVNPLVGPNSTIAEIEERWPIDKPTGRALPDTQIVRVLILGAGVQVIVEVKREELRSDCGTEVQTVARTNLRMAEPVGGHGKFDGDPRILLFVHRIEAESLFEDGIDALLPDRQRQEFVQDDPLNSASGSGVGPS